LLKEPRKKAVEPEPKLSLFQDHPGVQYEGKAMTSDRNFEYNAPITWVGRVPVYLATVLAGVFTLSVVLTSVALAVGGGDAVAPFIFSYATTIGKWQLWQLVTYALVNPPTSILLILQVVMFAWFGAEVEKFLGRKSFAWLCGLLLLAMPALLVVLRFFNIDLQLAGFDALTFSIFLAFALIYPRAQIIFSIEARWIAIGLMALYSLQAVAFRNWTQLIMLWWGLAVAALWLKCEGVASLDTPAISDYLRRKHSERNLKVVRPEKPAKSPEAAVHDSIDPILEKIARQGIGSLSRGEREKLERARAALLEKERGH
jgi:hypothetical protein